MAESETPPASENPPPKRRRWRRRLRWMAAFPLLFILWLVAVVALMPTILSPERVRDEAVRALTDLLRVPVQIGRLEYHPLTGAELFDVVIGPPPGFERDVFRADRIAAKYSLSDVADGAIHIRELAIDDPTVVLETKNGQTNLDAILAKFTSGATTETTDDPDEPAGGALSPIDVHLEKISVGAVRFEMVGDGPQLVAEGARLEGTASIDGQRLAADLTLKLAPTDGPNVVVDIAAPTLTHAEIGLSSTMHIVVNAATFDGLALQDVKVDFESNARADVTIDGQTLPTTNLGSAFGVRLDAGADELVVSPLTVALDEMRLLAARVSVEGLSKSLSETMGAVSGRALAASLGLVVKHDAKIEGAVTELALPLDRLGPYLVAFVPGLGTAGKINGSAQIEGGPARLLEGTPSVLSARLEFNRVAFSHDPSGSAAAGIDGLLEFERVAHQETNHRVDGDLVIASIRQDQNRIGRTEVRIDAGFDHLTYPPPGLLTATVAVTARDITVPGVGVNRAQITATLTGDHVLHETREGPPVEVGVRITSGRVAVAQPDGALRIDGAEATVGAALDQLLSPSEEPIAVRVRGKVGILALPDGTSTRGLRFAGPLRLGDPRHGTFDADTRLTVDVREVRVPQAQVENVRAVVDVKADRIGPRRPPKFFGAPPSMLPAKLAFDVRASAPKISGEDPSIGKFEAALKLKTKGDVDVFTGRARLKQLDVSWPGVFVMTSSGEASRIYDRSPRVRYDLKVPPVDLTKAVAHIPKTALQDAADLEASGKFSLDVHVDGNVPAEVTGIDFDAPPMNATIDLAFDDINLRSERVAIDVHDLNGTGEARLGKGKARVDLSAKLRRAVYGGGETADVVEGLVFDSSLGLDDDRWEIRADGAAKMLAINSAKVDPSLPSPPAGGATFTVDLTHPTGGGVELTRLALAMPASGIAMEAKGRLAKVVYGVLRPQLEIDGRLRLEHVRPFIAGLEGAAGEVGAKFSVSTSANGTVSLDGALKLKNVDYVTPGLTVRGAAGRLPFNQRLELPRATLNERVARQVGNFGDDIEARLEQLQNRFRSARMVLDTADILVDAPRTADHQALRPYRTRRGPHLEIASVRTGNTELEDVLVEASYGSGMIRLDRVEARLWDGDVSGDLAVQLMPNLDVRFRTRGTVTNLNLDQPYAAAKEIAPETDPEQQEKYRASATFDLEVGLQDRTVNGDMDVFKISRPLVERLFGALFPDGDNPAVRAIKMSERVGLRPSGAKVWIAHNLLNAQFEFDRLWVHVAYESWNPLEILLDTFLIPARIVLIPTLGGLYVIPSINEPIRRISVSNVIDPILDEMGVDRALLVLRPYVVSGRTRDEPEEQVLMTTPAR